MDNGAIDFRKLLREEKKKARQKLLQEQIKDASPDPNSVPSAPAAENGPQLPEEGAIEFSTLVHANRSVALEENVEAIDFGKLVHDEKDRAARKERERSLANSLSIMPPTNSSPISSSSAPIESSSIQHHLLCSNPPTIYYVSRFLPLEQDQQSLMEWLQSLPENPNSSLKEKESSQSANGTWTPMHYAKRRVALFDNTCATGIHGGGGKDSLDGTEERNKSSPPAMASFPPPLQRLADALVAAGIFSPRDSPNHILINEYHPGQGIMAHTDGPAYMSLTATLSLGSDVLIQFTPRPNYTPDVSTRSHIDEKKEIMDSDFINKDCNSSSKGANDSEAKTIHLASGSLLVFEDSAYLDFCHQITDRILEEVVTEKCLNVSPGQVGTAIQRGYRISLTFRHKHT